MQGALSRIILKYHGGVTAVFIVHVILCIHATVTTWLPWSSFAGIMEEEKPIHYTCCPIVLKF